MVFGAGGDEGPEGVAALEKEVLVGIAERVRFEVEELGWRVAGSELVEVIGGLVCCCEERTGDA